MWLKNNGTGRPADIVGGPVQTIETHGHVICNMLLMRCRGRCHNPLLQLLSIHQSSFCASMFDGSSSLPGHNSKWVALTTFFMRSAKNQKSQGARAVLVPKGAQALRPASRPRTALTLMAACASRQIGRDPAFSSKVSRTIPPDASDSGDEHVPKFVEV